MLGLLPGNPTERIFPAEARPLLLAIAKVGLLLFIFMIGWEFEQSLLRDRKGLAAAVSLSSILLAFTLGAGLAFPLYPGHSVVQGKEIPVLAFALFMGAAMSIIAFPVLARILNDSGLMRTRVGALALASAAVDDVVAWCLLAFVSAIVTADDGADLVQILVLSVIYVAAMIWLVRPLLAYLVSRLARGQGSPYLLAVLAAGVFLSSCVTTWIGIHAIVGAFLFGFIMPREPSALLRRQLGRPLDTISLLLPPVFFIVTGLGVDIGSLAAHNYLELAAIILVTCAGKLIGAAAPARAFGMPWREAGTLRDRRAVVILDLLERPAGWWSPAVTPRPMNPHRHGRMGGAVMRMEIAWWDLDGSPATVERLGQHLVTDRVPGRWRAVAGLHEKFWIADPAGNRWGAVMIWDERPAVLPPNLAADLIGYPVTHRDGFEVQASVRGPATGRGRGPAHRYVVVDAFATEPLLGNPVAVFSGAADLTSTQMQRIAREMNLSEVTFLLPPTGDADARVRVFTPVNELPFAGHPLLGTAVAVALDQGVDRLRFETVMGVVPFDIDRVGDSRHGGGVAYASMEQPIPVWRPYEQADALLAALGVASSTLPVEIYRNGPRHVFVGLPDADALSGLRPDHRALTAFPDMAANCFAPDGDRWRARMFSPAYGVVEDPATGSAAGPLAIHLARYGHAKYGQTVEIHQGVELGRRSVMFAEAHAGDVGEISRVRVSGYGAIAAEGTIYV